MNSPLRKDTAKIPEEILNECKTPFERHVLIKLHEGEVNRNLIIDAVDQIIQKADRIEVQTTKTNGRVTKLEMVQERFNETYKVWLIVGGGIFSIVLLLIAHFIK